MITILRDGDRRLVPVLKQRAIVARLQSDRRATDDAAWPGAYRAALVRGELQRIEHSSADGANRWAKVVHPKNSAAPFPDLSWATLLDLFGVDGVSKLITDRLDRLQIPEGLAPVERAARLREIEQRLFDAEVEEESIICRVEAEHDVHVLRRPDIDARAVVVAWQRIAA